MDTGLALAIIGAALAVSLPGIGSSIGIGYAGQESLGVMSEDPKLFGRLMLLVALPGTQGIYGFVAGFLVIAKVGILGGETLTAMPAMQGLQILGACLPIAFAGFASAIYQGKVCSAGVGLVAKKPEEMGKAMVMGVFVEFYAVLGLLMTIFLLQGIKL